MDKFLIVTNQDKDIDLKVTKEIQKYEEARDWLLYQSHQSREA